MLDDLRKTIEATIGELTPARAKSLAKSMAGPGAAKDQVAKATADLIEWSQKNRERLKGFVRREVSSQLNTVGVATQAELDALKKRVRTLERTAAKGSATSSSSRATSKGTGGGASAGSKRTGAGAKTGTKKAATANRSGGGTRSPA